MYATRWMRYNLKQEHENVVPPLQINKPKQKQTNTHTKKRISFHCIFRGFIFPSEASYSFGNLRARP